MFFLLFLSPQMYLRSGVTKQVILFFFFSFFFAHFYFPAPSGQAVVTGVVPSSPRFLPSIFIAHRVQQSHCSSIFIEYSVLLLTHALALSASQFVHKKKSQRIYIFSAFFSLVDRYYLLLVTASCWAHIESTEYLTLLLVLARNK